ncbi:DUF4173 domain-containing protein [Bradyrhizobium genosp. L]|nr:DUF4173 domain-containing protein [Bradyrhizobium genosp. L]
MTSLAPPQTEIESQPNDVLPPAKTAAALALAALADWLFYDQRPGISVVIFAAVLACISLAANRDHLDRRRLLLAGTILLVGLVPAMEDLNAASLAFAVLALGAALMLTTNPYLDGLADGAASMFDLLLVGPFRLFRDAVRAFDLPAVTRGFALWFVPVLLGGLFVFLFATANPLFAKWIGELNPGDPTSYLSISRMLFWILALALVWPFLHVKWRRSVGVAAAQPPSLTQDPVVPARIMDLLGTGAILRSLILFNLLFAIQTVLDAIYLWGNGTLPADITYASYAHRGAYPLIATALLAAGFVLITMRPRGPAEQSRVMRALVYVWVGQNILLVISSMLRLDLYVQTYLLTYWRIAAFVWMLLVALGLILILTRIVLRRSNAWLVRANLISLTAVLYACSLTNFGAEIADYNVDHSREFQNKGLVLDMNYLVQLGPQALPAIDRVLRHRYGDSAPELRYADPVLVSRRNCLVEQQRQQMASWRSWSFRGWRLQRILDRPQQATASGS